MNAIKQAMIESLEHSIEMAEAKAKAEENKPEIVGAHEVSGT